MGGIAIRKRLSAIAAMVRPCGVVADIGADHGMLSAHLLHSGKAQRVICSDISESSLAKARALLGDDPRADFRLSDGLTALRPGEADCIIIAGMGGHTMGDILRTRPKGVPGKAELLLSAHSALPYLRAVMEEQGLSIQEEDIVRVDRRFYIIMRVVSGEMVLSDTQRLLGRYLPWSDHPDREGYLRQLYQRIDKEARAGNAVEKKEALRRIEEVL